MSTPLDMASERVARKIMNYLRANPEAADTVAGVVVWLEQGGSRHSKSDIEAALDKLVMRHLVVAETVVPKGEPIYRLRTAA